MANDTQTFEATPTLVGNNIKWKLCYTNPTPDKCGNSNGNFPDVIMSANKGAYNFHFKIVGDQTGKGIKFADTNPIQIKDGEPTAPNGKQIDQIGGNGATELRFVDKNSFPNKDHPNPVVLDYQLNFKDAAGNAVTSIDPDITNGGTNTKFHGFYDYLLPVGAALLAGIALTILFRSFVLRRAW